MCDKIYTVSNVFKGGNSQCIRRCFTEVWIKMINAMESSKDMMASRR
jgi:hypothetical protein